MQFAIPIILCSLVLSMFFFKSMLLRIMLLVVMFPLCVLYLYIQEVPLVGILEISRDSFSDRTLSTAFYSYLIGAIIFLGILWPIRKRVFEYSLPFKVGNKTLSFLFIMLILSSYSLLQIRTAEGGSASLYLAFSVMLIFFNKGFLKPFTILHICYILFIFSMGERVDSILTLIYILVMNTVSNNIAPINNVDGINKINPKNTESYNRLFLYIGLAGVFVIGILSALVRTGGDSSVSLILTSLYAQQTITDVLYVYLCGVDYYLSHGIELSVICNALFGLIPGPFYGVSSNYNFTFFLINNYSENPGGGLFFTEGIIAFGPFGVSLYLFLLGLSIKYLFKKGKAISNILFILMFVMFCRIVWYGIIYTYKPILFSIIIYYIIKTIIDKKQSIISSLSENKLE